MSVIGDDRVARLCGTIQHYAWGGYTFLPLLIRQVSEPGVTYAEYWLGAHEKAPSSVIGRDGSARALHEVIREQPDKTLGLSVAQRYGRLPYLLKVMDVREMLSIQLHPTKAEAERGFARENELGIPLDAPERNYKDDNHKPELEIALSDFWLLHGFRPHDQLQAILAQVPEFHSFQSLFASDGCAGLYKYVMEMPQESVNALLDPLVERLFQQYQAGSLDESSPGYWVTQTREGKRGKDYDRGIFSLYFLNLVKLKPGQATFQDAGIPHAYLRGKAIEIMANSDNVIRGGLTPKHIDVPELLRLIVCEGMVPKIIEGKQRSSPYETIYESPSSEFCLSSIQLEPGNRYENTAFSIEMVLVFRGEILLESSGEQMLLKKGESVVIFAGETYRVSALCESVLLFRASIPHGEGVN